MEGVVSGSFIVFVCMLLGSIFLGRIFCGWLCPIHISVKHENDCVSCRKCSKICPMGIQVSEMVNEGQVKNMECIQCGACIDGAPKKYYLME